MPKTRTYVQEASRLAERNDDGSFRVVIITEGTGSTGVYSAELMENSAHVFENTPSYANHPIDPERVHERDVLTIMGRLRNVTVEDGEHGKQLGADFYPREEYRSLIEEFGDLIGLSIFCGAYGEKDDTGRVVVESFDDTDPYRSVDLVVAAGRGGRFKRAEESLRAIESSLGLPEGHQPGAASAQDPNHTQEEQLDKEELKAAVAEAIADALKPISDFLANEDARRQAEADAAAARNDGENAVEAAIAAVESVKAAKLLPSLEAKLVEAAKKGELDEAELEFAKKVTAEAAPAKREETSFIMHTQESATRKGSFALGGSR